MMNFIAALLTGLFIGFIARWFYPGDVPMGWVMTSLLGVGGSILASLVVGSRTGNYGDGISRPGCIASVLGAMVLIFVARLLT